MEMMDGMDALGHVRDEPAAEIVIADAGQLSRQRHSKPNLEQAAVSEHRARDAAFEQHDGRAEQRDGEHRPNALPWRREQRVKLHRGAQQETFDEQRRAHRANGDGGGEGRHLRFAAKMRQEPAKRFRRLFRRGGRHVAAAPRVRGGLRAPGGRRHAQQHGAADARILARAVTDRPRIPVFGWNDGVRRLAAVARAGHQRVDEPRRLSPAPRRRAIHHGRGHPRRRVEPGQHAPVVGLRGLVDEALRLRMANRRQLVDQDARGAFGCRPRFPFLARHTDAVGVNVPQEAPGAPPVPAGGRIHDLEERPDLSPHQHEVRRAVRQTHDGHGRQDRPIEDEVVGGNHDLLGRQSEPVGDVFDRVDRGAVEIRLARLAQTAIADVDAETFEQGFERRRATVERGGLDDLWNEKPAGHCCRGRLGSASPPTRRSNRLSGDRRSTSMSMLPRAPCMSGAPV